MNNELLKRIEKLETETQTLRQAIFEIRTACLCVGFEEPNQECPGSICGECDEQPCICKDCYEPPEEPEEHECDRECPDAPCVKCGEYGNRGWED